MLEPVRKPSIRVGACIYQYYHRGRDRHVYNGDWAETPYGQRPICSMYLPAACVTLPTRRARSLKRVSFRSGDLLNHDGSCGNPSDLEPGQPRVRPQLIAIHATVEVTHHPVVYWAGCGRRPFDPLVSTVSAASRRRVIASLEAGKGEPFRFCQLQATCLVCLVEECGEGSLTALMARGGVLRILGIYCVS